MAERWKRLPKLAKWSIAIVALLVVIGIATGSEESADEADTGRTDVAQTTQTTTSKPGPAKPKPDAKVDKNTRAYMEAMTRCEAAVALIRSIITAEDSDPLSLADNTTSARDICEDVRGQLLRLDTDKFDNEAATGFHAIDRYKSGLNAVLAYIDNPRPTKVIEARNKLQEGDRSTTQARNEINERRRAYGLKSIKRSG